MDESQSESQPSRLLTGNTGDDSSDTNTLYDVENAEHGQRGGQNDRDGDIKAHRQRLYNICLIYGARHGRDCWDRGNMLALYILYFDRAQEQGYSGALQLFCSVPFDA